MFYVTLFLFRFLIVSGTVSIFTMNVTLTTFERTQSLVVYMAFTLVSSILPILITPFVGHFFDKVKSSPLILLLEGACLFWLLIAFGQYHWGGERPFIIDIICVSVLTVFLSSRHVSQIATIPSLVSRDSLPKVHALSQISTAVVQIIVPMIAFNNIFALSIADTFHFMLIAVTASIALGLAQFTYTPNKPPAASRQASDKSKNIGSHNSSSGGYLAVALALPTQLKELLLFNVGINFFLATFNSLFIPHVLSFSDKESLSYILSVGGISTLISSMLFTRLPLTNINYIFVGGISCGIAIMIAGLTTNLVFIALLSFLLYSGLNTIVITADSVWQLEVQAEVQGRVTSLRKTISIATVPLAHATLFGVSYLFSEYTTIDLKSQLDEILVVCGMLIIILSGHFMMRCKSALTPDSPIP